MINELAKGLFGRMKAQDQAPAWSDEELEVIRETNTGDEQDVGWVSVYIIWDSADAVAIVARLQDEGIPALARPDAVYPAELAEEDTIAQIEVLVPEAMSEHARRVLWDLGLLNEQDESDEYYAE